MLTQIRATALEFVLLITRLYVANVFIKSGLQKLSDPDTTQFLFENVYNVPLLPPAIAAQLATWSEIIFGVMLLVGVFTSLAALALFALNAVAVYAYSSELLKGGFGIAKAGDWVSGISLPAGFEQHLGWGVLLLFLAILGAGIVSIDAALFKNKARYNWF